MAAFPLAGAVAVVTGAASGIGERFAGDLAAEGAYVVGVDVAEISAAGGVEARRCDVSDAQAYQALLGAIEDAHGRIDVLANVAGHDRPLSALSATVEDYRREMDVNFFSVVAGTLKVLPGMCQRGRGAVVNVASDSVRTAISGESAYVATKGAIAAFTESVAHEVWERGVAVHVLYPGFVETPMGRRSLERGMKSPPKAARRTAEQVSAATIRALGGASIEINTVKGAVLPPLLRAFTPGLYRRLLKGRAAPG